MGARQRAFVNRKTTQAHAGRVAELTAACAQREQALDIVTTQRDLAAKRCEELEEEVAFWKAETLECRNVLADVVKDRGELDVRAIAYYSGQWVDAGRSERINGLISAALKYGEAHFAAAAKEAKLKAAELAEKKSKKMKRGKR